MTTATRILVSAKGETGYLHTEIRDLSMKAHYSLTLDPANADVFPTAERAERAARKVAGRFDRVELETAEDLA